MKKAVIVLPTFNEKENIKTLIPQIFAATNKIKDWSFSVLIVDDNSPDGTATRVKKLQTRFDRLHLLSGKRQGLGRAYIRGFSYILPKLKPEVVFEMDADWSHEPSLIPQFIKKIEAGADFVIGARYIKGGSIPKDWAAHRKLFSYLGNLIIRLGFMVLNIHDWTSGYRAIKGYFVEKTIKKMKNYNGYVFQVALLDQAKKEGLRIEEVPLNFKDRKKGVSKINFADYILRILLYVFLNSSFIKYVIVGMIGFIIDFGVSFVLIELVRLYIWLSTVISAELATTSNFLLNNFWSFAHKKIEPKPAVYFSKFIHFNFISVGSIIIQAVGLHVSTTVFPRQFWFIYKALIIVFLVIPYSYFMYNYFIWPKRK